MRWNTWIKICFCFFREGGSTKQFHISAIRTRCNMDQFDFLKKRVHNNIFLEQEEQ